MKIEILIIVMLLISNIILIIRSLKFNGIRRAMKLHGLKNISNINNVWTEDGHYVNTKGKFTGLRSEKTFLFKTQKHCVCVDKNNRFYEYEYKNEE
jgi:hypothetical protein